MEPEIRAYLVRIANTIAIVLSWMVINSSAGIMHHYAFMEERLSLGNIIFYTWLILSGIWVTWYLIRLWSKPLNIPK